MEKSRMESYNIKPEQVANTFISLAVTEKLGNLTPLKLIKLVYIFYAWYLYFDENDTPPFKEQPEAWKHGPVFPSLHTAFGRYGGENLNAKHFVRYFDSSEIPIVEINNNDGEDSLESKIISIVWGVYKNKTGEELSELTHEKGSAWDKAYSPGRYEVLNADDIREGVSKAIKRLKSNKEIE